MGAALARHVPMHFLGLEFGRMRDIDAGAVILR
jgi:hypothetical protein